MRLPCIHRFWQHEALNFQQVLYGSRKTEIPAASRRDCLDLSRPSRRPDAGCVLARQVTLNLAPHMRTETPDEKSISAVLRQLTDESRILDAGVYDEQGDLVVRAGESVEVRDRLALDGKKAGGYFNQQIVEPIQGKNGPLGYLRLTLDTHTLATEARQVDNTTNILRLMLLLSLAIGVVLTRT